MCVEQCKKAVAWTSDAISNCHNSDGVPKKLAVVGTMVVDWKDGFTASEAKNNRGSPDLETMTLSPPKTSFDGTGKVFPVVVSH